MHTELFVRRMVKML